jgi:hypothetical protein
MDLQAKIHALESQIDFLRTESDRAYSMQQAMCDQIDVLHKRIDEVEKSTKKNFAYMDEIFEIIGKMIYPIYYKVFPGALEADNALDRIVKAAKKKPTA